MRNCANTRCSYLVGASEEAVRGRTCGGCHIVRYRDVACSKADWRRHKGGVQGAAAAGCGRAAAGGGRLMRARALCSSYSCQDTPSCHMLSVDLGPVMHCQGWRGAPGRRRHLECRHCWATPHVWPPPLATALTTQSFTMRRAAWVIARSAGSLAWQAGGGTASSTAHPAAQLLTATGTRVAAGETSPQGAAHSLQPLSCRRYCRAHVPALKHVPPACPCSSFQPHAGALEPLLLLGRPQPAAAAKGTPAPPPCTVLPLYRQLAASYVRC
jgi:hypothetical protein